MGHDRCVVGICDNDRRYPQRYVIHSNVSSGKLSFHKLPASPEKRKAWINAVAKGRKEFVPPKHFMVCSNHFIEGKPTKENPIPTLFLTRTMNVQGTPQKICIRPPPRKRMFESVDTSETDTADEGEETFIDIHVSPQQSTFMAESPENMYRDKSTSTYDLVHTIPMTFAQITRDGDVSFFTGLEGSKMFESVFKFVERKAQVMTYWCGSKKTLRLRKRPSSIDSTANLLGSGCYQKNFKI